MSNFSNLFPTYSSQEAYMAALVKILETDENAPLNSNPAAGTYGFNGEAYTIGYGYDIRFQTGAQIINDFTEAGIFTTANTTGTGQYANLYNQLQDYDGGATDPNLADVNAAFIAAFGTDGINQSQALALLDDTIPRYTSTLATFVNNQNAQQNGFTLGNNGLQLLLMTEWYNGQAAVFGPMQAEDIASDNVTNFLENVLFFNNTSAGVYSKGLENRRMNDLATALGLSTFTDSESGLTTIRFSTNSGSVNSLYAALDIAQAIILNASAITSQIATLSEDNSAASNLTTLKNNLLQSAESSLLSLGYYVPQSTDGSTPAGIKASVANMLANRGVVPAGFSAADLASINSAFSDSSFTVGGLVHVPVASAPVNFSTPLLTPPSGETDVFDPSTSTVYTVGASLDKHDSGGLLIDAPGASATGHPLFDNGTYKSISYDASSGIIGVTLEDPNGDSLGTLTLGTTSGTNIYTLNNGETLNLPANISGIHVTDPVETPEQVLVGYLSELGYSTTASALNSLDDAYYNPTGTAYTVTGGIVANGDDSGATVTYEVDAPGAVVNGESTATITVNGHAMDVPATNVLLPFATNGTGDYDISQDSISGVQVLDNDDSDIALTQAQFNSFTTITGSGGFTAASGGTFSLAAANVDPDADFNALTATDWSGTTLIGTGTQTLTASLFGNDTLEDGYAEIAGEGVDSLTGTSAGTGFEALDGLAAGSSVTGVGSAGNNQLVANGDISGASISGIGALAIANADGTGAGITLTASQFNEFGTIYNGGDGGVTDTINAATGGSYNIAALDDSDTFNMNALSNDGTTLIDNDSDGETVTGSATGNDTLTVGAGNGDTITAGSGVNTIATGAGSGTIAALGGLAAGSSVDASAGDYTLEANGDLSSDTIAVSTLAISGGDDSITINAANDNLPQAVSLLRRA